MPRTKKTKAKSEIFMWSSFVLQCSSKLWRLVNQNVFGVIFEHFNLESDVELNEVSSHHTSVEYIVSRQALQEGKATGAIGVFAYGVVFLPDVGGVGQVFILISGEDAHVTIVHDLVQDVCILSKRMGLGH